MMNFCSCTSESIVAQPTDITPRIYVQDHKNDKLRFLFAEALLAIPIFMTLIRIPSRMISLITGDFLASGLWLAEQELEAEQMAWAANKLKGIPQTPLKQSEFLRKSSKVVQEFVKNLFQIVSYPVAIAGMEISVLVGLLFPQIGREWLGWIEHIWSRSWIPISPTIMLFPEFAFTDYLFPCMQKKTVWDKRNLYRISSDYSELTLRSELRRSRDLVERFGSILLKVDLDLSTLQRKLRDVKPIKYSRKNRDEINAINKYAPKTQTQRQISDILFRLNTNILWAREGLLRIAKNPQTEQSIFDATKFSINNYIDAINRHFADINKEFYESALKLKTDL